MARFVILGGLLLLALLAATLVWRLQPGQARVVAPGGEIRYDDFGFSIDGLRRASSIGEGGAAAVARGEFLFVTLGVHNHGRRVDFTFQPSVVRLIAGDGTVYIPDDAGTAALAARSPGDADATSDGRRCTGPLGAGDSCTAEVAFDVPPGTRGIEIRMQFEAPIFEFVYMLIHGRQSLALPEC